MKEGGKITAYPRRTPCQEGGAYAVTYGTYTNPAFCLIVTGGAGSPTYGELNLTQVEGLYDGSRYYNGSWSTSGGCSNYVGWGAHWNN